jgi:protein-tyrosine phosphatase
MVLASVIDLHSHILPGLDDGPATLEGSLELARAAVADGIAVIAATPHVRDDFPTTADEMEAALGRLRAAVADAGIALEVRRGGELDLARLTLPPDELGRFGLGGSNTHLLVETPYHGWPLDLGDRLSRLWAVGFAAVLAHPERNADVQADPEGRLRPLVDRGALVQLTAASVDGRLGRRARDTSMRLLELELAHLIASDAHTPAIRAVGMSAAAEAVGDDRLAHWLTRELPTAIVSDAPAPPRPEPRRRARFVFF